MKWNNSLILKGVSLEKATQLFGTIRKAKLTRWDEVSAQSPNSVPIYSLLDRFGFWLTATLSLSGRFLPIRAMLPLQPSLHPILWPTWFHRPISSMLWSRNQYWLMSAISTQFCFLMSKAISGSNCAKFSPYVKYWIVLFLSLKGRCHGNQFYGQNWRNRFTYLYSSHCEIS